MCRALTQVLTPHPSILGLLPPPSLLRMLFFLLLWEVFSRVCSWIVPSLIISPGGDVSIFMKVATTEFDPTAN
ncbi:unnamed protein product [Prunus armeniaca]